MINSSSPPKSATSRSTLSRLLPFSRTSDSTAPSLGVLLPVRHCWMLPSRGVTVDPFFPLVSVTRTRQIAESTKAITRSPSSKHGVRHWPVTPLPVLYSMFCFAFQSPIGESPGLVYSLVRFGTHHVVPIRSNRFPVTRLSSVRCEGVPAHELSPPLFTSETFLTLNLPAGLAHSGLPPRASHFSVEWRRAILDQMAYLPTVVTRACVDGRCWSSC